MLSADIMLENLHNKNDYERVTVNAKGIRVEEPVKVSLTLQKQDVTIADATSAAKLTVW